VPDERSGRREPIPRTLYAKAVLVDTGGFVGYYHSRDAHHDDSVRCFGALGDLRLPVFVHTVTIAETHRRLLYDVGPAVARKFLHDVYNGSFNIIRHTEEDERAAIELIDRYESLNLTLADALCMAVMTARGIGSAFSYDRHFLQAGYIRIPPIHF
jgi:uncharacterized protein